VKENYVWTKPVESKSQRMGENVKEKKFAWTVVHMNLQSFSLSCFGYA